MTQSKISQLLRQSAKWPLCMLLLFVPVPSGATANPACPVYSPSFHAVVILQYTGATSGCASGNSIPCLVGETITFVANYGVSCAPCPSTYAWNFGDSTTANTQTATHAYSGIGSYVVHLDGFYATQSGPNYHAQADQVITITVSNVPTLTPWMLGVLLALLGIVGFARIRL